MSLYFERALRAFDPGETDLLRATTGELRAGSDGSGVDLAHLARLAPNRADALAHPDRDDWLCLPLHERDSADLSDRHVAFEDHPVRGPVFVYHDPETGEREPLDADAAGETALAERLRFWLPEFTPDERPSYAREGPWTTVSPASPVPEGDREGYFDRLAGFVADEREAQRERNRERARSHTPRELFADGESAIPDLTGFATLSDGVIQCHVAADSGVDVRRRYGIYEGDEVLLHAPADGGDGGDPAGDAPVAFPVPMTVERLTERTVDLAAETDLGDADALAEYLNGAGGTGLSQLLNPTTYDREAAAVETVRNDPDRRAVVLGEREARFANETAVATRQRDADLDPAQSFAAAAACYADDVCCVHGPPGTGKTRVLVDVVRRAVAAGERALVCADSNQAVDNLLVGESGAGDPDPGSLHYYATAEDEFDVDRHHEYRSDRDLVRETYGGDPRRPDVVATTNNSAADFPDGAFDLAVVDEATQATTPSTFVPYAKADRLVLAGDHRQLPPYHATDDPGDGERYRSLFERLYEDDGVYGSDVGVFLRTQYRMHEDVAAFPNRAFYDGLLETGVDVDPVGDLPPLVGVQVDGEEREDGTGSYANPAEADAVADLVERLLGTGLDGADVGVIAPYRAQVRAVESELGERGGAGGVTVDTIDSFQGGERAAVVVTFTRSNDRGDVGFLGRAEDGPRRLNVALTRAERFCGLVGDWDTLRDGGDGRNACADLYRALYDRVERTDRLWTDE